MTERKKRLEKGVISLEKQIKIHQEKREEAKKQGKIELEDYYSRELQSLNEVKERKKKLLDKE